MKLSIKQKIILVFSVLMIVTLCVGTLSYWSFNRMELKSNNMATDVMPTISATKNLLKDIINMDTGVRGYIISGKDEFMRSYTIGADDLKNDLATIQQHEVNYPGIQQLVENQVIEKIDALQKHFEQQIELVKAGKASEAEQQIDEGKQIMEAFLKVHKQIDQEMTKVIQQANEDSLAASFEAKLSILIGGVICLIISFFAVTVLIRGIVIPIRDLNQQLSEIAEGDGDLTRTITVKTQDEIKDLSLAFNKMVSSLRHLITEVLTNANQVASSAEELALSAEQTSKATEQIATTIQEVVNGSEKQVMGVSGSTLAITEMSQELQGIATRAEDVTMSAKQSAEAAVVGNDKINETIAQMNLINNTVGRLGQIVDTLGKSSEEIGQIVEVISSIAGQTNLLALNAAIEAARAGEHGRGFAVVADEVRKLAEQSSNSTQKIADLIGTIQSGIREAVEAMKISSLEVQDGMSLVDEVGSSFVQIQESAVQVATQVEEVTMTAQQLAAGASVLLFTFEEITTIATNNADGTHTVSAASEEQLASMEEITASTNALAKMAENLQRLVCKFKV